MISDPRNLKSLYAYNTWANRELLSFFRKEPLLPQRSQNLFSHILSAERLWLDRLHGRRQSLAVWPILTIDQMGSLLEEVASQWVEVLDDDWRLRENLPVSYTNSKGESFQSRPWEILTHVPLHSTYHRGQIATDLRAAGITPPYTDYIHAVRTRAFDE